MSVIDTSSKPFEPGTTGWTAADLDDPAIEALWFAGRYEIIDGVLTKMPPAFFDHGAAPAKLIALLDAHFEKTDFPARISFEVDVVIDADRVVRADLVVLTAKDQRRQEAAAKAEGRKNLKRTRILVPPLLVAESLSPGHEAHDTRLKRRWYAEFGIPNYWIIDWMKETMQCLILQGGKYVEDAMGRDDQELHPRALPGLVIPLHKLWS